MQLKAMHYAASAVHLALGVWATVEAASTDRKWDPAVYVLQTEWLQKESGKSCEEVQDGCTVVSTVGSKMPVNAYALCATFFFISAAFELAYAAWCHGGLAGSWRWGEFALSASIQFFVISILSNSVEFFVAFLSAIIVGFMQVTGYVLERSMEVNANVSAFQAAVLGSAMVVLGVAWSPVLYHIGRASGGAPLFVYFLIAYSCLCYFAFGIVMMARLGMCCGCGRISEEKKEFAYTLLSFLAKAGVMVIYFAGTQMRDGLVTSANRR